MVNLTRIYTKTGDGGQTRLADNTLTSKTDVRVAAYGDVDEANSAIGVALATGGLPDRIATILRQVQNELFDVGADLATPLVSDPEWQPLRVEDEYVARLEQWCDEFTAALEPLRSFILPGGSAAGAQLHVCRTLVRRAERTAWLAVEQYGSAVGTREEPGGVHDLAITYLNRLSDLLFILARAANGTSGDVLWVPGGDRRNPNGPGPGGAKQD